MGHLLMLKCAHLPWNLRIASSTSVPIYTHDGASAKFFSTSLDETDYSAVKLSFPLPTFDQLVPKHDQTNCFRNFLRRLRYRIDQIVSLWARRTGPRAPVQRCARWRCQFRRIWQRSGWWQLPRTSAPDPGKRDFQFINNNFVCTGRVPDPTSLFLPTSFCM